MYQDPVKQAEKEIEELLALQNAELNPEPEDKDRAVDTEKDDETGAKKPEEGQPVEKKQEGNEDPNSETYKQRWLTSQGIHRADLRRLNEQVASLTQQNQSLTQQLQEVQARKSTETQTIETGKGLEETLSDLEEEYGPAFTAALDKRIDDRLNKRLSPVEQTVQEFKTSQVETARDRYVSELTEACPQWATQNTDPDFIQYLEENVDDLSGRTYLELLTEAHREMNAPRVARFFNMYSKQQPTPPRNSPEELLAPSRRGSGDQVKIEDNKGKVYTLSEINEIYKRIELGKYTPEKAKEMELEIWRANKEGRIIG